MKGKNDLVTATDKVNTNLRTFAYARESKHVVVLRSLRLNDVR